MKLNLTIDEMAIRHLTRHKNDKSYKWLSRMNGRFGRKATNEAIQKNKKIMQIMGVEMFAEPNNPTGHIGLFPKIQGRSATLTFLDDLSD